MHLLKFNAPISYRSLFYLLLVLNVSIISTKIHSQESANYTNEKLTRVTSLPFKNDTGKKELEWLGDSLPGVISQFVQRQFEVVLVPEDELIKARKRVGVRRKVNRHSLGTVATLTKAQVAIGGKYTWDEETQLITVYSYVYIIPLKLYLELPPVQTAIESGELFTGMDKTAALVVQEVQSIGEGDSNTSNNRLSFNSRPSIVFLACALPEETEKETTETNKLPNDSSENASGTESEEPVKLDLTLTVKKLFNEVERDFSKEIKYKPSRQYFTSSDCDQVLQNPQNQIKNLKQDAFIYTGYIQETSNGLQLISNLYSMESKKVVLKIKVKNSIIGNISKHSTGNLAKYFKSKKY